MSVNFNLFQYLVLTGITKIPDSSQNCDLYFMNLRSDGPSHHTMRELVGLDVTKAEGRKKEIRSLIQSARNHLKPGTGGWPLNFAYIILEMLKKSFLPMKLN